MQQAQGDELQYDASGRVSQISEGLTSFGYTYRQDGELAEIRIGGGGEVTSPTLTLESSQTAEEQGQVTVTFRLSQPSSSPVYLEYTTEDGAATAGADYQSISGSLLFAPGELTKQVIITLLDDDEWEETETFSITISNLTEGVTQSPSGAIVTVTSGEVIPLVDGIKIFQPNEIITLEGGGSLYDIEYTGSEFFVGQPDHTPSISINPGGRVMRHSMTGELIQEMSQQDVLGTSPFANIWPLDFFGVQIESEDGSIYISASGEGIHFGSPEVTRGMVTQNRLTDLGLEATIWDYNGAERGAFGFGSKIMLKGGELAIYADGQGHVARPQFFIRGDRPFALEADTTTSVKSFLTGFDFDESYIAFALTHDPFSEAIHYIDETKALYLVDRQTGNLVWKRDSADETLNLGYLGGDIAIADQTIVTTSNRGQGGEAIFIDRDSGEVLFYKSYSSLSRLEPLSTYGNTVFLGDKSGVYLFSGKTREWVAKLEPDLGEFTGSMHIDVYEDEVAVITDNQVHLYDLGLNEQGPFLASSHISENSTQNGILVSVLGVEEDIWEIDYEMVSKTASPDIDYSANSSGRLEFRPQQMNALIPIDVIDDELPEKTETLLIRFKDTKTGLLLREIEVQIIDNDTTLNVQLVAKSPSSTDSSGRMGDILAMSDDLVVATSANSRFYGQTASVLAYNRSDLQLVDSVSYNYPEAEDVHGRSLVTGASRFLIGAPGWIGRGMVHQFNDEGEYFNQMRLGNNFAPQNSGFGTSMATTNTNVIVGAPNNDAGKGSVYLFTLSGSYIKEIKAPAAMTGTSFGDALAATGDTCVTRVSIADDYKLVVFSLESGQLLYEILCPHPDAQAARFFAESFVVEGDYLVVGNQYALGHVYIYDLLSGSLVRTITPPVPTSLFGCCVAVSGGEVVVKGRRESDENPGVFRAVITMFDLTTGKAVADYSEKPIGNPHAVGGVQSIAIDGNEMFVGWIYENNGASQSGAIEKFIVSDRPQRFSVSSISIPSIAGVVTGQGAYESGEGFELAAYARSHFEFIGWSMEGNDMGAELSVQGTVTASDFSYRAHFNLKNHPDGYTQWIVDHLGPGITLEDMLGTADIDGDGRTNLSEFRENTLPGSASSRFRFQVVETQADGDDLIAQVESVEGFEYWAEWSDDLEDWYPVSIPIQKKQGDGRALDFSVPKQGRSVRFVRIVSNHEPDLP
ncbi:MAG: Calx-beta domain-containing protein [Opitutaceae bacterium]